MLNKVAVVFRPQHVPDPRSAPSRCASLSSLRSFRLILFLYSRHDNIIHLPLSGAAGRPIASLTHAKAPKTKPFPLDPTRA